MLTPKLSWSSECWRRLETGRSRNLLPLVELKILPWTKILTLIIWPKFAVSGPWNIGHAVMALVYSFWSHKRYILIWNINLLPLIGLAILHWTKILTWSTDGRTHVQTTRTLYAPGGPRPWGLKKCIWTAWTTSHLQKIETVTSTLIHGPKSPGTKLSVGF